MNVIAMSKIDDIIKEKSLKPSDCLYHTNRSALNKANKPTGKIRVLATQDSVAHVEYKCPECSHEAYTEQPWSRPFYVKCSKCGFRMSVPKMKDQFKKEMKAENARG